MKPGWVKLLVAMIIGMGLAMPVHAQFWSRDPAALPTPTAFVTTLELGDLAQAQAWLDAGLAPDFMGSRIGSGLMIGAWEGNIDMMRLFISRGANINRMNGNGETAIILAAWRGQLEAVKWLVERGARINAPARQWSPLHYAVFAGHREVADYLMDQGADINALSTNGSSVLMMAIYEGREGLAQLLIETACGARERGGAARPLSPIDLALLEALVRPLAQGVASELSFSGLETELAYAAAVAPPSEALVTEFSMRVQTETFRAQLIVAGSIASPAKPDAGQGPVTVNAHPAQGALSATLTVRVASLAVPLSKLSGLKPGATLLLGVPADQPVELISGGEGGVLAAEAEIGRRGGRIALRITRRGPALGPLSRA